LKHLRAQQEQAIFRRIKDCRESINHIKSNREIRIKKDIEMGKINKSVVERKLKHLRAQHEQVKQRHQEFA